MMIRLQLLIAIVTLVAFFYVGNQVRKRVIELKYALVWFFVAILFLVIDLFPGMLESIANAVGIELPINMLMLFGFGFILLILYTFTIVITNQDRRIKRLIQETALLNYRMETMEAALKKQDIKLKKIKTRTADPGPEHKVKIEKNVIEETVNMEEE